MKKIIIKLITGAVGAALVLSCGACTPADVSTSSTDTSPAQTTAQTDGQSTQASEATANEGEETTPAVEDERAVISVIAAGDNLVHEAVYTFAQTLAGREDGYTGEYYFHPMYGDVKSIVQKADIAMINQESQVCTMLDASGYPRFVTPPSMGDALIDAGFNVIVTANNHMLDSGDGGLADTVAYWKDKPVITVGSYTSEADSDNIAVFEKDGLKVALLAFTDIINRCDDYDEVVSSSKYAKYSYYTPSAAEKQIEKAQKIADLVIVSMHWGDEDEFDVTSSQREIANDLASWGADVIIGHHPHVVQGVEWIQTDNGKTLCVYSLGNFLSTMLYARNMVGMMVSFDVISDGGDAYVDNVQVIPTVTNYTEHPTNKDLKYRQNVYVYLLENYTEEMASEHGCNVNESKAVTLDRLRSYITDNVPTEFLPEYLK